MIAGTVKKVLMALVIVAIFFLLASFIRRTIIAEFGALAKGIGLNMGVS